MIAADGALVGDFVGGLVGVEVGAGGFTDASELDESALLDDDVLLLLLLLHDEELVLTEKAVMLEEVALAIDEQLKYAGGESERRQTFA